MKIQNLNNSPKVPFDLDGYVLHSENQLELVHLLLKPCENLAEHKNPFDVIFYVVQGSGVLTVENDSYELSANDTTKITSDKNRSWKNTGDQDLRILVIKLF